MLFHASDLVIGLITSPENYMYIFLLWLLSYLPSSLSFSVSTQNCAKNTSQRFRRTKEWGTWLKARLWCGYKTCTHSSASINSKWPKICPMTITCNKFHSLTDFFQEDDLSFMWKIGEYLTGKLQAQSKYIMKFNICSCSSGEKFLAIYTETQISKHSTTVKQGQAYKAGK